MERDRQVKRPFRDSGLNMFTVYVYLVQTGYTIFIYSLNIWL